MAKQIIPLTIIELDADGVHILIETKIGNDEIDAFLIIDTGASKSVIDESILLDADFHTIETEFIESSQLTEMIAGKIISIHCLKLGEMHFNNFQALTMQLDHINSIYKRFVNKPIAGLLGGDFLIKNNAVIDYKKKELRIRGIVNS